MITMANTDSNLNVGLAIKSIRSIYDMRSKQLAENLDISPSYLSEIETGRKTISLQLLNKFSKYFKLKPSTVILIAESIAEMKEMNESKIDSQNKIMKIIIESHTK